MSKNIDQIYTINPITSNASTDLMYFGQSPYGVGDDAAMTFANFAAQLGSVTPVQIQNAAFVSGIDSGVADAYVVTLSPSASFTAANGTAVSFSPLNANATTSPTLSVNGSTPLPIVLPNNTPVQANDINTGSVAAYVIYSNGVWLLMNALVSGGGVTAAQVQQSAFNVGTDTGAADAYVVALSPAIGSYTNGLLLGFTPANQNATTTPTVTVNALSAANIVKASGALVAGDMITGEISYMIYSTAASAFILLNPATVPNPSPFASNISVNSVNIGRDLANGVHSTLVGYLSQNTAGGSANTSLGANSLQHNAAGSNNTAIGSYAMGSITDGNGNVAVGDSSFQFYSGTSTNNNTAIGNTALNSGCTADGNVSVGNYCLANGAAGGNVAIGQFAASNNNAYSNCTFLGISTDSDANSASGVIAIGSGAQAPIATGSTSSDNGSSLAIGSSSFKVGFRGDGTIYPTASVGGGTLPVTFAGYLRVHLNGTFYKIPLYPD